jgi:hypothetical protein
LAKRRTIIQNKLNYKLNTLRYEEKFDNRETHDVCRHGGSSIEYDGSGRQKEIKTS